MAFINSILSIFTPETVVQIDFFKANPIKSTTGYVTGIINSGSKHRIWSEISLQHYFDCRTIPGAFTDRPL